MTWTVPYYQHYSKPIHKTNTLCNHNYTDGELAAAIPTVKGTESDVIVFATEDEQEGVLYLFMVSQTVVFASLREESTLRCMYFVYCDTSIFSCPFNLLIFFAIRGAKALATALAHNVMC